MKTSHTPGPWNIAPCNMIESKGGDYICKIDATEGSDHYANARLIAAAPELLKTAAELLRAYDAQYGKLVAGSTAFADAYLALHNAIAKATQP